MELMQPDRLAHGQAKVATRAMIAFFMRRMLCNPDTVRRHDTHPAELPPRVPRSWALSPRWRIRAAFLASPVVQKLRIVNPPRRSSKATTIHPTRRKAFADPELFRKVVELTM
jgi:hypothetical protein